MIFFEVGLGSHPQKVFELFLKNGFTTAKLFKDLNGDNRALLI